MSDVVDFTHEVRKAVPGRTRAHGVTLAYLDWPPAGPDPGRPVLMVPGAVNPAESWAGLAAHLRLGGPAVRPRRCVALSVRGRGLSVAPVASPGPGYRLEDQAGDLRAVAEATGLADTPGGFVVLAHSMGVALALRFALDHPSWLKGLVLGDYPPCYRRLSEEWSRPWRRAAAGTGVFEDWEAAYQWDHAEFGVSREDFARPNYREVYFRELPDGRVSLNFCPQAMIRVQEDSAAVDFLPELGRLDRPVLVLRGAEQSLLTDEAVEAYRRALSRVEVLCVPTGHDVFTAPAYPAIDAFLAACDRDGD